MALSAARILAKEVVKKTQKTGSAASKKVANDAAKMVKVKVSKVSDMKDEKTKDKLGVEDGKIKKRRGRPKKFQTLAEVEADINLRELKKAQAKLKKEQEKNKQLKKAKIQPAKLVAPPEAGLEKLEEKVKINAEKITIIKEIQQTHRTNHQKEKAEIAEINNVLTGIADFIRADYDSRISDADEQNQQAREDAAQERQSQKEKDFEKTGKKANDRIGKTASGIISPVKGVFQRLMDAVTAIGLGIVGNAAFKFLAKPEIFEKLNGAFDFIAKHFEWVMGALGAIALIGLVAPLIAVGSAIAAVIGAIAACAKIVAIIALTIGGIILAIKGATDIFKWLRGGSDAQEARKKNREEMEKAGVEKAHISGIFGERYNVMRDGKKTKLKYSELTDDEKAVVDKFKEEDKRIKEVTKERNKTSKERKKKIAEDRKASEEFAEIQAMPKGKEKRIALDAFKKETIRLQNESDKEVVEEFKAKYEGRKIGGDASGMKLVGEDGPEIVEFKTAVNVVPAHRTQETLKTLGQSGGTNIVTMDLPPIKAPTPEVNVASSPATETEEIPSVNPFNNYMVLTPEILRFN